MSLSLLGINAMNIFHFPLEITAFNNKIISNWRLTVCVVGRYLSSALCQHRGPLDTRSQYHGLSLASHFLFFLAKNAGEHLPLGWSGPSVGPNGYTQLHLLHGAARIINITQTGISQMNLVWLDLKQGKHTHGYLFICVILLTSQ